MLWRWRSIVALVVMAAILVPLVLTGEAQADAGNDGIDYDCGEFLSHGQAQAYFVGDGGSAARNVDDLDRDRDGAACENLPGGGGGAPVEEGPIAQPTTAPTEPGGPAPTAVGSPAATKPVGGVAPQPVVVLPSTGVAEPDTGSVWRPYAGTAILVLAAVAVVAVGVRQRRA